MENQKIQVLGSGCSVCKQLLETVEKIVSELNLDVEVEYITDIAKMIEMGVMASPILAVNGNPILIGGEHSDDEIKAKLSRALLHKEKKDNSNNDSCCGSCCDCSCK